MTHPDEISDPMKKQTTRDDFADLIRAHHSELPDTQPGRWWDVPLLALLFSAANWPLWFTLLLFVFLT